MAITFLTKLLTINGKLLTHYSLLTRTKRKKLLLTRACCNGWWRVNLYLCTVQLFLYVGQRRAFNTPLTASPRTLGAHFDFRQKNKFLKLQII